MCTFIRAAIASCIIATTAPSPASATVDSWIIVKYPLVDMQVEDAKCEGATVVQDAHSSGPASSAKILLSVLSKPIEVPNPLSVPPLPADANAITSDAKASVAVSFDIAEGEAGDNGTLTIDASELSRANGPALEGRQDSVKRVKALLYYTLSNFFRYHAKARVTVRIEGLADQTGLSGTKLPVQTQSPYSTASPVLKALATELKPTKDCPIG